MKSESETWQGSLNTYCITVSLGAAFSWWGRAGRVFTKPPTALYPRVAGAGVWAGCFPVLGLLSEALFKARRLSSSDQEEGTLLRLTLGSLSEGPEESQSLPGASFYADQEEFGCLGVQCGWLFMLNYITSFLPCMSFPVMNLILFICISNYAQHKITNRGFSLNVYWKDSLPYYIHPKPIQFGSAHCPSSWIVLKEVFLNVLFGMECVSRTNQAESLMESQSLLYVSYTSSYIILRLFYP